jgi:hypothetical protein
MTHTRLSVSLAALVLAAMFTGREANAQRALVDDDRAYSAREPDRAYISARCAALYLNVAESAAGTNDSLYKKKGAEAMEFLHRVPPSVSPESVFLDWSNRYGQSMKESDPRDLGKSLWAKDYRVCSPTLDVIRGGDRLGKYSRAELRFLFGQ